MKSQTKKTDAEILKQYNSIKHPFFYLFEELPEKGTENQLVLIQRSGYDPDHGTPKTYHDLYMWYHGRWEVIYQRDANTDTLDELLR